MSDRSRGEGLSRRDFVGTGAAGLSTAALGSAALSATLLPPARTKADAPEASDVAPTDAAPTDAAPTRRSRTTPEAVLVRGLPESVGGHTIVDARLHLGAVAVRMRAPDGSAYQVDVLRRAEGEPARGVRETAGYALFLANRVVDVIFIFDIYLQFRLAVRLSAVPRWSAARHDLAGCWPRQAAEDRVPWYQFIVRTE